MAKKLNEEESFALLQLANHDSQEDTMRIHLLRAMRVLWGFTIGFLVGLGITYFMGLSLGYRVLAGLAFGLTWAGLATWWWYGFQDLRHQRKHQHGR